MVERLGNWLGILVATTCTLGSGVALAEPFQEDMPDDATYVEPPRERWYGWQTLSVDALPAGLFAGALSTEDDTAVTFWGTGALTFAFGGPVVHVLHDRPLIGLASLGLRLSLPVLGMAIAAQFYESEDTPAGGDVQAEDPSKGASPLAIAGLVGAASASALDAVFLAYEDRRIAPEHDAHAASPLGVSFGAEPGGGSIAVLGAF